MLVILSDVHLTDGSSGTTINLAAFDKFRQILQDVMGDKPSGYGIDQVHLVLLGDIFDVIRSSLWLQPDNQNIPDPVRPWSPETAIDAKNRTLKDYTEEIVADIIKQNGAAMGYLQEFAQYCASRGVQFKTSYVVGNHDWLINRYPSTRTAIARFLQMPDWEHYRDHAFPIYLEFQDYGVMARHGDYFDPLNYSGDRDRSSLGDALVIDLLNHFPQDVKEGLGLGDDDKLFLQLKEIDNVRPLLEIPAWIRGVCRHYPPAVEGKVHGIWNSLAAQFFQIPYVRGFLRANRVLGLLLRLALKVTSGLSFGGLMTLLAGKSIRRWYQKTDDYKPFAFKEPALAADRVRYVVYGHTHSAQQIPLDISGNAANQPGLQKLYFNSGTWRMVFEHTAFDRQNCEFIGWHVLTFLVFYLAREKEAERKYEVWSASLGYGR
jgi:UDP-2,3-diacylglucosamine pyrophosphatase LpxH